MQPIRGDNDKGDEISASLPSLSLPSSSLPSLSLPSLTKFPSDPKGSENSSNQNSLRSQTETNKPCNNVPIDAFKTPTSNKHHVIPKTKHRTDAMNYAASAALHRMSFILKNNEDSKNTSLE